MITLKFVVLALLALGVYTAWPTGYTVQELRNMEVPSRLNVYVAWLVDAVRGVLWAFVAFVVLAHLPLR
jgi:hypothetical protein